MNFGGIYPACSLKDAQFVVIPVPYDLTSTYQPGSRRGPAAIIEASTNMELYDEELKKETYLAGIHTTLPVTVDARGPKNMVNAVRKKISRVIALDKIPVMLGGEHSISLGAVQAVCERYPKLTILQLDAHADLRDSYQGTPYNHACVARRITEICPLVQVGIRSMSKEEGDYLPQSKVKSYSADYVLANGKWAQPSVKICGGMSLLPSIWMYSIHRSCPQPARLSPEALPGMMFCNCCAWFRKSAIFAVLTLSSWRRCREWLPRISWLPN